MLNKKPCAPTLNDMNLHDKVAKVGSTAIGAMLGAGNIMACAMMAVFATDSIGAAVGSGMQSVYNVLKAVAIPVAVIAFAVCAYYIFVSGEKGMEKAKKIAIYTIIGIAIVFLAPLIIENVTGWFSGLGTNSESNVFSGAVPVPNGG